jgi:hypothetical protein
MRRAAVAIPSNIAEILPDCLWFGFRVRNSASPSEEILSEVLKMLNSIIRKLDAKR